MVILAAGLALVTGAWGQAYPGRPLRVVIPFPAGGTTDLNARAIAAQLERQLGQSIVVDNRAVNASWVPSREMAMARSSFGIAHNYANT